MKEETKQLIVVVLILASSFLLGSVISHVATRTSWQQQVIQHNCGQYNPKTGEFEWK